MDEIEQTSHSFIVKVWRERVSLRAGRFSWRGHITHVPDGKRRDIRHFNEIVLFIAPYLRQMGVLLGWSYALLYLTHAVRRRIRRGERE
jgi:hypothetical protein